MMTAIEPRDWRDDRSARPELVGLLTGEEDGSIRPEGYVTEVAAETSIDAGLVEGAGTWRIIVVGQLPRSPAAS